MSLVSLALVILVVCVTQQIAAAYSSGTYGSSTYGSCDYGSVCSISLADSGNVSLNVTPTVAGSCTVQSDSVSVLTDDANGYILTLTAGTTNTSLVSGSNTIPVGSGTRITPLALTSDTWGYRTDGVGGFGNGPTTAKSNVAMNSTVFAALLPSNSAGDMIASSTSQADPAVSTTVWYGVCANTLAASGSYSTQVMYTAVVN
jgi:hypothetical protein